MTSCRWLSSPCRRRTWMDSATVVFADVSVPPSSWTVVTSRTGGLTAEMTSTFGCERPSGGVWQAARPIARAAMARTGSARRADVAVRDEWVLLFMIFFFLWCRPVWTAVGLSGCRSGCSVRDPDALRAPVAADRHAERVERMHGRTGRSDRDSAVADATLEFEVAIQGRRPI